MLFLEQMETHPREGKIQTFATDIDKPALEIARAGRYLESIAALFTPQRLSRFFTKADGGYLIKKRTSGNHHVCAAKSRHRCPLSILILSLAATF